MTQQEKDELTQAQKNDTVINVTLSKEDYEVLRDMLEKQKSLRWLGKYLNGIIYIGLGSVVALVTFGDSLKKMVQFIVSFFMSTSS